METLIEFRRRLCGRCGMGSTAALTEHAQGFHDTEWEGNLIGKDVDVYFNLHRKMWSVRDRKTRRVIAHVNGLVLFDVTFRVSAAGNARVRAEGRKNVHAFARGIIIATDDVPGADVVSVTYNPYKYTTFVNAADEAPVHGAYRAWFAGRSVKAQPWSEHTTVPVPLDTTAQCGKVKA